MSQFPQNSRTHSSCTISPEIQNHLYYKSYSASSATLRTFPRQLIVNWGLCCDQEEWLGRSFYHRPMDMGKTQLSILAPCTNLEAGMLTIVSNTSPAKFPNWVSTWTATARKPTALVTESVFKESRDVPSVHRNQNHNYSRNYDLLLLVLAVV